MSSSTEKPDLTANTPTAREVRTERIFHASRERVWQALTVPELLAQWWGRGNRLEIERFEPVRGGRWRFVEHAEDGVHGFEGRFREVSAPERIVQTFEWDGMPGHVVVVTTTLERLDEERTRLATLSLFHTTEERDGMLSSGMTTGLEESYRALDGVLANQTDERRCSVMMSAEDEVRKAFASWFEGTTAKDLDGLMERIAPDVVSYEHDAPLQYVGVDAVREVCRSGLDAAAEVRWSIPDLHVLVRGDLAVTWGLNRMRGKTRDGQEFESWSRGTRIFQKRAGKWQMIHQHVSFPYDPSSGQARTDLKP